MKTTVLFTSLLFCCSIQLLAQQNPLVGTWEVVSIKATDADGTRIVADGSQFKETKIITPTHYFLITERKQGDSLVFDKAIAGTVRIEGNKYIETPMYFSAAGTDQAKTDFTYKLEGDKFIQSGTITSPEGKVSRLDELVFKKVKGNAYASNPTIGTWNQLSSSGVRGDGQEWSHTNATHIRFQTITPTHWMRISYKDGKFENAMGGTYKMEGNKMYPNFEMASFPAKGFSAELTQRVEGNKMYWTGLVKGPDWENNIRDVFEKVSSKSAKTAAAK